jgi:hypothetical protein
MVNTLVFQESPGCHQVLTLTTLRPTTYTELIREEVYNV